jgi:hypothetical protein
MAIKRSHRRRPNSKARTMRRAQRGGDLAGNPPSSWGWVNGTLGNGWTQFMNSLSVQPGSVNQGNQIVPVNGGTNSPKMAQTGGKRRRRGKRGGNMLAVAEQAAVPLALFAMNNSLGSRHRGHKHGRRSRRR